MFKRLLFVVFMFLFVAVIIGLIGLGEQSYPLGEKKIHD